MANEVTNQELVQLTPEEEKMLRRIPLDEEESEHLAAEPYSYWKSVFRVFLKKPAAIIGLSVFAIVILGMIIFPLLTPEGYTNYHTEIRNLAPSAEHLFGTDIVGRDIFFMIWIGLGKSLILALISSAINIVIGTIAGLAWGYFRKLDPIFIEVYNLISNVPSILLYMLLSVIFSKAFPTMTAETRLIIALCLFGWVGIARFIRNFTIIINNREYNVASKTLGTNAWRIMTRNLFPFLLGIIITELSLMIPGMISSEVTLSFFGFGLPGSDISIGAILDNGRELFTQYPWQLLAPAGALAVIIFIFYLLGLALSDSLDPKKHR